VVEINGVAQVRGGRPPIPAKVATLVVDMRYRAVHGPIRRDSFGPKTPQRWLLVSRAPELLIEAIAARPLGLGADAFSRFPLRCRFRAVRDDGLGQPRWAGRAYYSISGRSAG
jgi:hypothetical protein